MQNVAELEAILERHGVALEKWLIRLPNGASWPVVRIPQAAECNVCGSVAEIPRRTGRVPCAVCGALVLTITAR